MKREHLAVLSKILLSAAVILIPCGYARAQKLKYVTFFPIPFGSHSEIFVKNKAILGAGHNAEIIFKDTINLAADQQGNSLEIMELNLSPLLENGATDNNDIPIVALEGGIYTAKIETQNNAYSFNKTKESFFKLGGSSGNAIKFDSSDFKFIADSAIDYTVHSDTLNMGEKNSYTKPLLFHNANNGNIGEIEASDCRRFCWVQIKLPREKEFKYYLACHNADKCPATGFEPVNKVEPKYYHFYTMVYGGKGFFTQGAYDQNNNGGIDELNLNEAWISFGVSTDDMTTERTQNRLELGPGYNLNLSPEITYYYSEESNLKLPDLTVAASYSSSKRIGLGLLGIVGYPYNLLTAPIAYLTSRDSKFGYVLTSNITLTLPDPPVSDDPATGAVKLDERPPDCPAGASGETICLKAQAKNYRCIRRTLYNPSIDTKISQMKLASLAPETATNGAGEIVLYNRKKWEFDSQAYGTTCTDECEEAAKYAAFVAAGDLSYILKAAWAAGKCSTCEGWAQLYRTKIKYCCPALTSPDNTCMKQEPRLNPINYVTLDSFFTDPTQTEAEAQGLYKDSLCKSTMTQGCKCHILKKDNGGWLVNDYDPRYFHLRLRYYTPQWEDVATMIECQNTEYKEDGLY